jgi:AcrR family transcriptional regulator
MAQVKVATADLSDRPRSRKGAATRLRLVDAAKQVFERDGFLEARIVDIAETAHLAPGSFYHYFESKEQIFREVAQAQEERLTAPADAGSELVSALDSPWELIRRANRRADGRHRAGLTLRRAGQRRPHDHDEALRGTCRAGCLTAAA